MNELETRFQIGLAQGRREGIRDGLHLRVESAMRERDERIAELERLIDGLLLPEGTDAHEAAYFKARRLRGLGLPVRTAGH